MEIPQCQNGNGHNVKMRRYRMHTGFCCLDCMEWVRLNPGKIWLSANDIAEFLNPFGKSKSDIPELPDRPSNLRCRTGVK